ncbi:L-lactate dehydrogenase [Mycetocola reblochoni]|uniref:L-lactate dehydrogenase n=3 Tax=Mycetocola reblochoni TaxID=331618 RepID=A0A1R4ISE0_9MICO|nr:L-lactate dehydrogenase [Mycetocola reblochoni]RLP71084.1 L-lactate dehydrogenase [Mycetocola reblochoni]SJN22812.1 L-lactate dehydrogenase [Mycetocola reblochoni REB411]
MHRRSKLSVIGAGSVGSSLAYASLIRGSADEVVLQDINAALVDAEVLDIAHGAPLAGRSTIGGGADIEVTEGSDVIVVTAGAKQRPGQTRLDLAGVNARILDGMIPRLVELSPDAVIVLVTNPCDVLTVLAAERADLPAGRVFSSGTVLDSSRLRNAIARHTEVPSSEVQAVVLGEHGDSAFSHWSQATVAGVPVEEWRLSDGSAPVTPALRDAIDHEVVTAAYRVIEGKGATNYAIGLSGARIVEAVLHDEGAVLPVSSPLDGVHGITGVALSLPSVVGASGVARVVDVALTDDELDRLHRSAGAIADAVDALH